VANILIYKIEFLQNNPYGDFVAGDVLDIYIDEGSIVVPSFIEIIGISVEKNGTPIGSGALITFDPSIVSVQNLNVQICSGTYLISLGSFAIFPYAQYVTLANHYSCVVNPPTCNLLVIGAPTVIPSTDESTADGSITVTATSTNAIKYKLNSDFAYDDGTGQSSSTFSALLPGDYRIFLRDSVNCAVNVLVNVPFSNTFGTIYRLEYTPSIAGFTTRIDITKRGYSSVETEICGGDVPFTLNLRGEGSTLKYEPMLATDADIVLASETNSAFIELYTNDRNLYRVNYYKDFGSGFEHLWTGKVLPFIYMEPVSSAPYYSSFRAADGLAELKDNVFVQRDGQKFFGTVSLIKLVAYCLSFLKLDLNIRVAVNLYAVEMDSTDSDDPFDQAYIDYECFYLATKTPNADFVLRHILKSFNARITQWDNVWNIVRVDEMAAQYDYREFDSDGEYVSNSNYNPVKNLDFPSVNEFMWENGANLELQPGYGRVKVNYSLGLKPNIINNGDFRLNSVYVPELDTYSLSINKQGFTLVNAGYALSEGYELLSDVGVAYYIQGGDDMVGLTSGGNAYLQTDTYSVRMGANNQLKINIRYKIYRASVSLGSTIYQIEVPYVKIRLRVKYGSLYLQSDGTWTSTDSTLSFFATVFNGFIESEIVAKQPTSGTPSSGMDFDIRLYHAYAYYAQFQSVSSLDGFPTYSGGNQLIPTGYKTELRDSFTAPSYIYYYELEENTSAASGYDIIRPDDYHVTNNPRQWILKLKLGVSLVSSLNVFPFYIDRLRVTYLTGNEQSIDAVIRETPAETLNPEILEDDLIIGSYSEIVTTEVNFGLDLGFFYPGSGGGVTSKTISALSADLIYTGWLRDIDGVGYEFWARDGVAESDKLHGLWLKQVAAQYDRTWRMQRGTLVSKTGFFSPIDSLKDVNDSDRIYIPISLSINDKMNMASGEFLELIGFTGSSNFSGDFSDDFGNNFD
jgi:hypothetical protein